MAPLRFIACRLLFFDGLFSLSLSLDYRAPYFSLADAFVCFGIVLFCFFVFFFLFSFDDRNDARQAIYPIAGAANLQSAHPFLFNGVIFFFPFVYFLHMLRREYYTCRPGDARLPTPCWEKEKRRNDQQQTTNQNVRRRKTTTTTTIQKKYERKTKEKFLARPASSLDYFLSLLRSLYKNIVETPY